MIAVVIGGRCSSASLAFRRAILVGIVALRRQMLFVLIVALRSRYGYASTHFIG